MVGHYLETFLQHLTSTPPTIHVIKRVSLLFQFAALFHVPNFDQNIWK